jgi:hypothetical protein
MCEPACAIDEYVVARIETRSNQQTTKGPVCVLTHTGLFYLGLFYLGRLYLELFCLFRPVA